MPKCPDCRDSNLRKIVASTDEDGEVTMYNEPYYKCDVCRAEFDTEDVKE